MHLIWEKNYIRRGRVCPPNISYWAGKPCPYNTPLNNYNILLHRIFIYNQYEVIFIISFSNSSRGTTDLFLYFER